MDNKKWYFNRDGKPEEVELERWIWAVLYKDGTELHQFDDNGVFHQIGEVDQSQVKMWVLYQPQGVGDGRIDFVIPEGTEVSLIHKYKHYVFNAATPQEYRRKAHVFGYKVKGGQAHLNFILPDDRIVQSYGDEHPKLTEFNIQKK